MTSIEWTDKTWNPVIGCTPVSPGCLNCYAATMARRLEAMGKKEYAPRVVAGSVESESVPFEQPGDKRVRIAEVRGGRAVFTGEVRCLEDRLAEPLRWKKPARIFVNSMSDLFWGTARDLEAARKAGIQDPRPVPFEFIDKVFAVMALCPQHRFQVLTKRPERMAEYLGDEQAAGMGHRIAQHAREMVGRTPLATWVTGRVEQARDYFDEHEGILPNVALGASAEDQARLDERVPHLLRCPAAVRFLSLEPLLGEIDLLRVDCAGFGGPKGHKVDCIRKGFWSREWGFVNHSDMHDAFGPLHYIIVGGESGQHARPCDIAWVRSIVKQCADAGVLCFVKQLGARPIMACPCSAKDDATPHSGCPRCGGDNAVEVSLRDRKGGDPAEWPEDLRVRDPWPETKVGEPT